jgi:hypothetical protein
VYISVNNNTNLNFLKILSNYTIWDRLSQKTISRYGPFNPFRHSVPFLCSGMQHFLPSDTDRGGGEESEDESFFI